MDFESRGLDIRFLSTHLQLHSPINHNPSATNKMRFIVNTLFVSACMLAGLSNAAQPAKPGLTYLYSATFSGSAPIDFGTTPLGNLTFTGLTGGTFSGPRLNGQSLDNLCSQEVNT
jgi:hypothetical protein